MFGHPGIGNSFSAPLADTTRGLAVEVGDVVRSGAGTYDIEVMPHSGDLPVTCLCISHILAGVCGVSACSVIPVGTQVRFVRTGAGSSLGFAFGACLPHDRVSSGPPRTNTSWPTVPGGGEDAYSSDAYVKLAKAAPEHFSQAVDGRPSDIFPGEWAMANENGVLLGIMSLCARIGATERSKLEMFVLDDLVRLTSGHFQHFSAMGDMQIYNDSGRLSLEFRGTSHQPELFGAESYEEFAQLRDRDHTNDAATSGSKQIYSTKAPADIKERLQVFLGDLGNLVHVVVCNPQAPNFVEPEGKFRLRGAKIRHSGLAQQVVATSGTILSRAAGASISRRSDTIPVPVKLREPWDPSGDKPDDVAKPVPETPYRMDDDDPWAASLLLRDQVAWLDRQMYAEFDRRPKTWHVPEEMDMLPPENTYDRIDGDQAEFKRNMYRKSYVGQLQDGSIVFRDAWGSEIFMRGGKIIISAPDGIEYRSGKSQVFMAGHDICMRARKSFDLSATDGDMRLKAQGNFQATAASRGILLQSYSHIETGSNKTMRFSGKAGEDVESGGIILKAEDDRIFIYGRTVQVAATCYLFIETLMAGALRMAKKIKVKLPYDVGKIVISSSDKLVHRCKNYLLSVAGLSGMRTGVGNVAAESGQLHMFGNTIRLETAHISGVTIAANGKSPDDTDTPMQMGEIIYTEDKSGAMKAMYAQLMKTVRDEDKHYGTSEFLSRKEFWTYDPDNPEDDQESQRYWINFTFRTPPQYRTDRPSEMKYAPSDVKKAGSTELQDPSLQWHRQFRVYQSPWQFMYKDDPDMVQWYEVGMNGTFPWPGGGWGEKDQVFAYIEGEQNVDYWGRATKRADMKGQAKKLKLGNLGQYMVMAHNAAKPDEQTQ